MKGSKLIVTLLLSAVLFAGCGTKSKTAFIKVNDGVVTQKEFDDMMDKALAQSPFAKLGAKQLKVDENSFMYLMLEQRVISQLIVQELMNQEADARNIKVTNKDLDEALKTIIDKVGGKDRFNELLKRNDVSISQFKKDLKVQVKMKKLAQSAGKIEVSDADAKKFYDSNKDKFKYPNEVRASHILIKANDEDIRKELSSDPKKKYTEDELEQAVAKVLADKKAQAEKLSKELQQKPESFAQYAKKYSEDEGTAKQGGDLGFFTRGRMVPPFEVAAFTLKPNTVSEPVATVFGYHIIKVTDKKEAGIVPFEKAKSDIIDFMTTEKELKALDDIAAAAKKKSKIEFSDAKYDPENINKQLKMQVEKIQKDAKAAEEAEKKAAQRRAKKAVPAKK